MKSLFTIAVVLLSITIFSATASNITQPNIPLILILNSDTIYPTSVLIVSGQASPNENIIIQVQISNKTTIQTLEATSDVDGHFKVDLQNTEPLSPGVYTVKATTKSSTAWNAFTVVDESSQLCAELEQTVKRTRSEAEAVYRMLTSVSVLATEMNASIQEGNSYYEDAQTQQKEGEIAGALEAYRAALLAYGEALHTQELMSSSKPPSPEAIMIMELLEKIRRLNDTVTDITNQTNQNVNSLELAQDLLTTAEKQLSVDDSNFQWTLEQLVWTMEAANTETQMISASTTLSRRLAIYKELYAGVLRLEKEMNARLLTSPILHPMLFDYIEKLKTKFDLMSWIEAVISGKPYIPPEPVKPPIDDRIPNLNADIAEAETKLQSLVENEKNATTLAIIYKAWDLIKEAKLSVLGGDADRAEILLIEAKTVMQLLR